MTALQSQNRARRRLSRVDRQARAWDLRSQGYTSAEIGQLLVGPGEAPLSRQRVDQILKEAERRLDAEVLLPSVRSVRMQQIARYEHIYSEAMKAWRKSQGPRKSASKSQFTRGTQGAGSAGAPSESTSQHVADREGDVRFLETAMKALEGIRKLTGADAPIDIRAGIGVGMLNDVRLDLMEENDLGVYLGRLAEVGGLISGITTIDSEVDADGVAQVQAISGPEDTE